MEDIEDTDIYPEFDGLTDTTYGYLVSMLELYHDDILPIENRKELLQWVGNIFPPEFFIDHPEVNGAAFTSIVNKISPLDVAKKWLLESFAESVVYEQFNPETEIRGTDTPWTLRSKTSALAIHLFGPPVSSLPAHIRNNNGSFMHDLTEDLAYGLVVGLENYPEYEILLLDYTQTKGTPLDREFFNRVFHLRHALIPNVRSRKYSANINGNPMLFLTPDFIQGIITAAEWTNRDPHTIITDLTEIDENNNRTPLNF